MQKVTKCYSTPIQLVKLIELVIYGIAALLIHHQVRCHLLSCGSILRPAQDWQSQTSEAMPSIG